MHGVDEDDLERQRIEKIKEVQEAVAKLTGAKFQKLENLQRMERMLNKEIELLQNVFYRFYDF